jgi:hypothetical protein
VWPAGSTGAARPTRPGHQHWQLTEQVEIGHGYDHFYFNRLYALSHDYFRLFELILLQKAKRLYAIIA